jgi:hypothetical protein
MTKKDFFNWLTQGGAGDVQTLVETLERLQVPWCMIGGMAVNHWAEEPMVTRDVDLVLAADSIEPAISALSAVGFIAQRHPWSINFRGTGDILVQISTDPVYAAMPSRSVAADVHGILMRVASLEDTLTGKLLAFSDSGRRPSKRQKDLMDISRLVESHPELMERIPEEVRQKLV